MADDTTADEPTADPAPGERARQFKYEVPAHWQLAGEAGSKNLDLTVEFCVTIGLGVFYTAPGAYRVSGDLRRLSKAVEWIRTYRPAPITFAMEQPPDGLKLRFELTPDHKSPRFAEIHGMLEIERPVARAIDAGLTVQCIGLKRFLATGQTRQHIAWLMSLFSVSEARALEVLQLTPHQAAAEDAAAPLPAINVVLPTRQTLSEITRDTRTGDITQVKQTERTV